MCGSVSFRLEKNFPNNPRSILRQKKLTTVHVDVLVQRSLSSFKAHLSRENRKLTGKYPLKLYSSLTE